MFHLRSNLSCLLSITDNCLTNIYFLSSFIFFYHWSSRAEFLLGRWWAKPRMKPWAESSPVLPYLIFFCFPWLLARSCFLLSPRSKQNGYQDTPYIDLFSSPLLLLTIQLLDVPTWYVPIGNHLMVPFALRIKPRFRFVPPSDAFLAQ